MQSTKKILAVKLRELGDTVLWTSALQALSEQFPGAQLHVLVLESSKPLLKHLAWIHEIHTIPSRSGFEVFKKFIKLSREDFDLVLGFHATTSMCRFSFLFQGSERVFHHHSWHHTPRFSTLSLEKPGFLQDSLSRDYEILKALGYRGEQKIARLAVSSFEKEAMVKKFPGVFERGEGQSLLALLPGASIATKRYPKDLWLEMVRELQGFLGVKLLIVSDRELSQKWGLKELGHSLGIPVLDSLSLRELCAALSHCDFAIGNDSGPKHIAAALGCQTLTFFGPSCFGDWHPYSLRRHPYLREEIECRLSGPREQEEFQFCTLVECSHLSCLRRISPKRPIEILKREFNLE